MPMPPTISEIGRDRAQDDAELPGRRLGFEQQVVGHDHVDVFLGVERLEGRLDHRDRGQHLVDRADLQRDLRELGLLGLHRARPAVDDLLAEPDAAGIERDVHVLVEVLSGQAAADPGRALPLLGHADDGVIVEPELDRLRRSGLRRGRAVLAVSEASTA